MKTRFGLKIGDQIPVKTQHMTDWKLGLIVGFGSTNKNPQCVRVILEGGKTIYTVHRRFIQFTKEGQ
jgi:hypothetical protein